MFYYIDPGTGSMLFTILIGVLSAGVYAIRNVFIKLRFSLSGGKADVSQNDKIPFVIFSDDKRYCTVFEPICDEFEKREISLTYMTASEDDPLLKKEYKYITTQFIGDGNKAFAKLNMLKADIVLSTTPGLDVYQWKRSRDVKYYVHIFHTVNDVIFYRMFGTDYYDALLLSGDYQIEQIRLLESMRNIKPKELVVVGQPFMDTLYEKRMAVQEQKTPKENITVLLAPTWGEEGMLRKDADTLIDELIATGYEIIIRPHPQSFKSEVDLMNRLQKKYSNVEWNRDTDNFDVLNKADILISDFSGVVFDFALAFDKPIIYTDISDFDRGMYDAYWCDCELWTFTTMPKLGKQLEIGKVKETIDECLTNNIYKENRQKAREESWANIGHSAELTADYLIKKHEELINE